MSARRMGIVLALGALLSLALVAGASASHERPKAATPDLDPLVVAYEACPNATVPSPNRNHAIFGLPSCNPPVQDSDYLTVGTPDANGAPAKSVGFVRKRVIPGDDEPTTDEADIAISVNLTDVRCTPALQTATPTVCANPNAQDGEDYSGELDLKLFINRITDHANGTGGIPATTVFIGQDVTVPCFETGPTTDDPSVGATCTLETTLDAVVGGNAVLEGQRALWQFNRTVVDDGGSDGDADNSGDGEDTFVEDGIFVP